MSNAGLDRKEIMIKLYTSPTCRSSRQAKAFFRREKILFREINIKSYSLARSEILHIFSLTDYGIDEVISKGKYYHHNLNNLESLPVERLVVLIQENPSLLRTPIVVDNKKLQVGYNSDDIRQFISRQKREVELSISRNRVNCPEVLSKF